MNRTWTWVFCVWACLVASIVSAQDQQIEIAGRDVTAGRLEFKVDDSGLPAQIRIDAAPADLPLELRGAEAKAPGDAVLTAIGRGPQLAAPMTVVALVDGKDETLQPKNQTPRFHVAVQSAVSDSPEAEP